MSRHAAPRAPRQVRPLVGRIVMWVVAYIVCYIVCAVVLALHPPVFHLDVDHETPPPAAQFTSTATH